MNSATAVSVQKQYKNYIWQLYTEIGEVWVGPYDLVGCEER